MSPSGPAPTTSGTGTVLFPQLRAPLHCPQWGLLREGRLPGAVGVWVTAPQSTHPNYKEGQLSLVQLRWLGRPSQGPGPRGSLDRGGPSLARVTADKQAGAG